jgi:hypothetical protein
VTAPHIGTLREGALHKGIKEWLARPGDRFEQPVDGYVIDMVRGDLLIEVQTGACTPLRDKLTDLLERHRVRLVLPLARTRTIERVDENGAPLSRRRAPWEGRIEDVFERLVSIPALLAHRRFELEILVTAERELRARVAGRGRGRRAFGVRGRALVDVLERELIRGVTDLLALLPAGLADPFSTLDLARAAALPRTTAQQMVYCLRCAGGLERVGTRARSHLYRRVA